MYCKYINKNKYHAIHSTRNILIIFHELYYLSKYQLFDRLKKSASKLKFSI